MKGGSTLAQIGLHWLIALMIPVQYLTGGSIERTHHAVHMGMTPSYWDVVQHHLHNYAGTAKRVLCGSFARRLGRSCASNARLLGAASGMKRARFLRRSDLT
jgi:cytochrome b561